MEVIEYVFRRLYQVGIRSVHGVPGDYILDGLDYLSRAGLEWIGSVNELEAGYAADGYARVKSVSALVTTFGVGELGAISALAGAYAEHVPIIHIVGSPMTGAQAKGKIMHHTLGDGDYGAFRTMSEKVSCFVANIETTAEGERAQVIDHAIRECVIQRRPVYIYIPIDLLMAKIDGASLNKQIDLERPYDQRSGDQAVQAVLSRLYSAKRPAILVDQGAGSFGALRQVREFVTKTGLPTFVTVMGKSNVDESLPNFCGVYQGTSSSPKVKEHFEASDVVLGIGIIPSDYNTGGFTGKSVSVKVKVQGSLTVVEDSQYSGISMSRVLDELTNKIEKKPGWNELAIPSVKDLHVTSTALESSETITHSWLWSHISSWLQSEDVIITETGTSNFGIAMTELPRNTQVIAQWLWGSIGYATGACEGAAVAAKELGMNRTVLFTGDGSFQLTATALSTMLRHGLTPIIFIICNKGFTIERYVHGWEASYNDIMPWKYTHLPEAFGAANDKYQTHQVKTKAQFRHLLQSNEFTKPTRLQLVEVWMPLEDAPDSLKSSGQAIKENAG
ncbi:hypothetical protein PV05_00852 [Exophiala xenobiotica]|uniref:Pyruvate decarboxylase n=1 Tax=Exophiala xenobiotica TaxID=348802 RepID=A0A0D2DEB8_9EURO|nr:uncharacterized protein PV05_00852 [Exophiala xenobiotica]KIW60652.1 hypothetical protein PV05_00852 [Exophiala xenobiotica]